MAILYRTNFQSRQIEEALRRYGRKYVIVGGFSFYQRAEIKDIAGVSEAALSPQDSISLLRIINTPARGIGRTIVEQIEKYALEHGLSTWDAIGRMIDEQLFPTRAQSALQVFRTMMQEMIDAVASRPLARSARIHHRPLRLPADAGTGEYAGGRQAAGEPERVDERRRRSRGARREARRNFWITPRWSPKPTRSTRSIQVTLLTMHNAKGLEFPVVFIAGMEEDLFPHSRSIGFRNGARRGAAALLRRDDARGKAADSDLGALSAALRRRRAGAHRGVALSERGAGASDRQPRRGRGGRLIPQVDLHAERYEVRQAVKRNTFTGKTYNSLENISQFFDERGVAYPKPPPAPQAVPPPAVAQAPARRRSAGAQENARRARP